MDHSLDDGPDLILRCVAEIVKSFMNATRPDI